MKLRLTPAEKSVTSSPDGRRAWLATTAITSPRQAPHADWLAGGEWQRVINSWEICGPGSLCRILMLPAGPRSVPRGPETWSVIIGSTGQANIIHPQQYFRRLPPPSTIHSQRSFFLVTRCRHALPPLAAAWAAGGSFSPLEATVLTWLFLLFSAANRSWDRAGVD